MDALLNASDNAAVLRENFAALHNPAERTLWVLVHWPDTFMATEALLRFDLGVGKRSLKRQIINVTAPVYYPDSGLVDTVGRGGARCTSRWSPCSRGIC